MSSKGGCDEEEAQLSGTKYERKRGCKLNDIKRCGKCRWSVARNKLCNAFYGNILVWILYWRN